MKQLAILLLAVSFISYLSAVIWIISKKLSQGVAINGIRLTIFALLITIILGFALVFGLFQGDKFFTNLHALWGGLGRTSLLIIFVSFQIILMFYVAPQFKNIISKSIPILVVLLLFIMFFYLN